MLLLGTVNSPHEAITPEPAAQNWFCALAMLLQGPVTKHGVQPLLGCTEWVAEENRKLRRRQMPHSRVQDL